MVAFFLAVVIGTILVWRYPVRYENPFLAVVHKRSPKLHYFLTRSYLVMLYTTPWILFSAVFSLGATHLRRQESRPNYKPLPAYTPPENREKLYVVVGESHQPKKRERAEDPSWTVIPEKGLYTNIACFGAVGSGKTTSFIRPIATQLLSYYPNDPTRRPGGIVLEVKGDFCHQVESLLKSAGRGDDYYEISIDTDWRYNPLMNPDLDEGALAYAITTIVESIYGKGKESFWAMASTNAMKFIILLHRLVYDYVTLTDIYETALSPPALERKLREGMTSYALADRLLVDVDSYGDAADRLKHIPFVWDAARNLWYAPLSKSAQETLDNAKVPYQAVTEPSGDTTLSQDQRAQFLAVRQWFQNDWTQIDKRLRTSIVEGISVFLSIFDTNQSLKRVFCPPKEVYDPTINSAEAGYPLGRPFPSFGQLIEEGRVVALNFPVALNPIVARTIGTLMKLDYQRAVILRIPQMVKEPGRHWRPTIFVADEYQVFVTAGDAVGDHHFFSLSRQARCIGIVATQSVVSLKSALSSEDAYRTLLQTFRNKIFLNTADDVTADYAARLSGKEDQLRTTVNVSEQASDAKVSWITGRTVSGKSSLSTSQSYTLQQLDRFPAQAFYGLRNAEAIVLLFDGTNPAPAAYCYLKPYWLPVSESWWDHLERGKLS
jgi:hypothetical protein